MAMAGPICSASSLNFAASPPLELPVLRPSSGTACTKWGWKGIWSWQQQQQPLLHSATYKVPISVGRGFRVCRASEKEKVTEARKYQLQATELLAELIKSDNPQTTAQTHVDSLTEDFFLVASTYLEMAKKEGNAEVVNKIETTLKVAMAEKNKTLRPEIRLLNQLLTDNGVQERAKTIQSNLDYLRTDSYFFQLLSRMLADVEKQRNNPKRLLLLAQLRTISKETKEAAKALKKSSN
ncbi:unnamed protein product [Sphagnum jensenii]|uniref:Uncharacterized protein n=1 Tax=Sphagnum jensenii TaxID=128206 RepID=A0ABP1BY66_9BRYO